MREKYKLLLQKTWIVILWIVLIYSTQHLIRDILSDIFGIHNMFTEFGHRESSNALWCGKYCKWTTFPFLRKGRCTLAQCYRTHLTRDKRLRSLHSLRPNWATPNIFYPGTLGDITLS